MWIQGNEGCIQAKIGKHSSQKTKQRSPEEEGIEDHTSDVHGLDVVVVCA
jgi:hypothetical protein